MENLLNENVVSTRVRLARNFADLPFLPKMSAQDAQTVLKRVKDVLVDGTSALCKEMQFFTMDQLTKTQKQALVEKHLISPNMVGYGANCGAVISRDEKISILVNEEDHIRIQVLKDGYDPAGALEEASRIDDLLEEAAPFAFDETFGYLTSCPTNVGTGLRASLMLHLPALALTKQTGAVLSAASKLGIASRGLYGEGSEAVGNFYQISNQVTLGMTEEEAIQKLSMVTQQIIDQEQKTAQALKENVAARDRVMRAYGILKYAQLLSSGEFMERLSDVKLGVRMGILPQVDSKKLDAYMVRLQPANLALESPSSQEPQARDELRARLVREEMLAE